MSIAQSGITVITETGSPETTYAFRILFDILLGIPWEEKRENEHLASAENFSLWYGRNPRANKALHWLPASGFLDCSRVPLTLGIFGPPPIPFQPEIRPGNIPELFPLNSDHNALSEFDLPAAIFFIVTEFAHNYPAKRDQYYRPDESASFVYQNHLHVKPILHLYADAFFDTLVKSGYKGKKTERKFSYEITIDIDNPWKFLNKGFLLNAGGFIRDLLKGRFTLLGERLRTISSGKDPYNVYELLYAALPPDRSRFFFLTGYHSHYDSRFGLDNEAYVNLIRQIQDRGYTIGLHPSFSSSIHSWIMNKEVRDFRKLFPDFNSSRQHFLMYDPEYTFTELAKLGIEKEYSVCPRTHTGFPTGMAIPYPSFDVRLRKETSLWIHPAQVMDRTLQRYMGMTPEAAEEEISRMIDLVKSINGNFILILHNETFSETAEWKGWRQVCLSVIEKLKLLGAG